MIRIRPALAAIALALAMPALVLANTTTSNLGLNKPTVGADDSNWGTLLNANQDTLDALFGTGPVLLLSKGGTGASTAAGARTALGVGALSTANTWTGVQIFSAGSGQPAVRVQNASLTSQLWEIDPVTNGSSTDLWIYEDVGGTFTARMKWLHGGTLQLLGGGAVAAPLNILASAVPTSPNNGDVWATSSGVFARVNGATQQLVAPVSQTWTPVITFTTPGNLSVTYTQQVGFFFETTGPTGNMCTAWFKADTSAFTYTTASGSLEITGLPVSANSTYQAASYGGLGKNWGPFSGLTSRPWLTVEGAAIILETGANSVTDLTTSNVPSGTNFAVHGQVTYPC